MNYIKLGNTGLDISQLCLGCMSFGEPDAGAHPWTLNEENSRPIFKKALESGINFIDTANSYSAGTSEVLVGKFLKEFACRDEIVLATKVCMPESGTMSTPSEPNKKGLSRKAIFNEIDRSLKRLHTDYIDLYQIHRWDYGTPIAETMEALHDVVKSGKVRYIGASSMYAWQFAKAQEIARQRGWTTFVSMQNMQNLLYREEEREMNPLCLDQGVGRIVYSPLARGRLTRPVNAETKRSSSDAVISKFFKQTEDSDNKIIDEVSAIAESRQLPMAQVSLAWLLRKSGVSAPIIGASKPSQIDDAIEALSVRLDEDEISRLEEHYLPHPLVGNE